jgi:glycine cleavage system H protein
MMRKVKSTNKDLYYTKDHEWVGFQGTVAYTGVCQIKFNGVKRVDEIFFNESVGFKKKGEIIAIIKYRNSEIFVHMPVDGKVLELNGKLVTGNPNILLDCSETSAWIALVAPARPHERDDLLLSKQYRMNGKSKDAKL